MVREGAPTTSLFALAKDVVADLRRHDGNRGWRVGFNGGWYNSSCATSVNGDCTCAIGQTVAFVANAIGC
jgi:hypothetical protein